MIYNFIILFNADNNKRRRSINNNGPETIQRPRNASVHSPSEVGSAVVGHLHAGRASNADRGAGAAPRALQGGKRSVGTF